MGPQRVSVLLRAMKQSRMIPMEIQLYMIPLEKQSYMIPLEKQSYMIPLEKQLYMITLEQLLCLTYMFNPDSMVLTVSAQSRDMMKMVHSAYLNRMRWAQLRVAS